jgi:uncharacterized protein YegL
MPLIFLLDTSASTGTYISQLNDSLNRFKADVSRDGQAEGILDAAVIQYSDSPHVLQDIAPVSSMRPTRLITGGNAVFSSSIREALRMTENHIRNCTSAHKPWIILISSSHPADDVTAAAGEIQAMQNAEKLRFMALSVGGQNVSVLRQLTDVVFKLDGTDFAPFFEWVCKCMGAIARTPLGSKPLLPPLEGNVYRIK